LNFIGQGILIKLKIGLRLGIVSIFGEDIEQRHYLSPVTTVVVRERFRPSCMGVINLRYQVDHLAAKAFLGCHLDRGSFAMG